MTTINSKNPRAKKLNAIMTKIAMFMFQETDENELDAQLLMQSAIESIEKAAEILINNDENKEK